MLIRAVVFDGLRVASPAIGVLMEHLAPVIEWEAGHFGRPVSDAEADEIVTGPAFVTGSALLEAARADPTGLDHVLPSSHRSNPVISHAMTARSLRPNRWIPHRRPFAL